MVQGERVGRRVRSWFFYGIMLMGIFVVGRFLMQQSPQFANQCCACVMYPFLVVQHRIIEPMRHWHIEKRRIQELEQRIGELLSECSELQAAVIALKAEIGFFDMTKELINFKKRYDGDDAIVAQIITKNFTDREHYFLIDAGKRHGVRQNMVACYKNCLLGRVVEVFPWYSKVVAITDNRCKVAAYCAKTQATGIHEGTRDLDATALNFVSHLSAITKGDYIISSGEGHVFPRGFGLGEIVSSKHDGLFHCIKVKPFVDLKTINCCCIWHRGIDESATLANS